MIANLQRLTGEMTPSEYDKILQRILAEQGKVLSLTQRAGTVSLSSDKIRKASRKRDDAIKQNEVMFHSAPKVRFPHSQLKYDFGAFFCVIVECLWSVGFRTTLRRD